MKMWSHGLEIGWHSVNSRERKAAPVASVVVRPHFSSYQKLGLLIAQLLPATHNNNESKN